MNSYITLEFNKILGMLADRAMSEPVKKRCLELAPSLNEAEVNRRIEETTQARRLTEQMGPPPLPLMTELDKVLGLIAVEAMLTPEQIAHVSSFLISCKRMKAYLKRAESTGTEIAYYGGSINELSELLEEIDRCIRNGLVDDRASTRLYDIRRQMMLISDQIKTRLNNLLRKNSAWFSESFVSTRNGRYTLPVKREYKNNVPGTVVDISHTGSTCFIEPEAVGRLQSELYELSVEEDSEVRRILYTLTALIGDSMNIIRLNIETMETLDFLFAKGRLSLDMGGAAAKISGGRKLSLINARHPLLDKASAVPLDFEIGEKCSGVVITGPNTGGKTVALKTVGLLSLMAQSGLHVPADPQSTICMRNLILCDIGDGQSIAENLSTFSSHITNIIEILRQANEDSLVLLDELGSGTDPAEGMGLAIAILDELTAKNCLFIVTTHYPEIKEYASKKPGLVNARMAFNRETLMPLYRLEIGQAGESCALYIAERLGMPQHLLIRAHEAAYANLPVKDTIPISVGSGLNAGSTGAPHILRQKESRPVTAPRSERFSIGDSVIVYPKKEIGIVYAKANEKGEVGVQVKGSKRLIMHKRLKLHVPASELYPENYDFSIVFDSVANRKARHMMDKRHVEGNVAIIRDSDE